MSKARHAGGGTRPGRHERRLALHTRRQRSLRLRRGGAALAAGIAVSVALASSCRTAPARTARPAEPSRPSMLPVEAYVPSPILRVGILTEASRISVGAEGPVTVWSAAPAREARRDVVERASFGPVSATVAGARFRVQVASLSDEGAAREASTQARSLSGLWPSVRWNAETRTYQVRVGAFSTRDEAKALASQLGRGGLGGSWVAEEAPAVGTGRIRLVEIGDEVESATVVPREGETLNVDGVPFRGLIEVRPDEAGTLTVINIVNMEDYLRGVVPNELSPMAFPQIEGLKAQAVAARTYALRNRGQFQAKGFDICATPACQVYRGKSTESPLSDRAVEETRGIAVTHHGIPINAMYTSTCGGYTEDASNVFEGEPMPYLRGVVCAPEGSAWATIRTAAPPLALGEQEGLARDAALLVALGVLEPKTASTAGIKGLATDAEIVSWMGRLIAALRRKGCPSPVEPPLNRRGTFFHHVVGSLCWEEREQRLLSPQDPDYLLQVEDRADFVNEAERLAAALLLQEGILTPMPDNTLKVNAALTRAQAVGILARTAVRAGAPDLVAAEFRGVTGGEILVKRGESTESHPIEPKARIFRALDGSRVSASEITLAAGDKVSYVLQDGRIAFLEGEQSRLGAAADRTSRFYRWEVRLTPADVAQAVARYGKVGTVRDLVPRRTGVSGRVVELAVLGSEGEIVLRGLKIRWALGLRENLFVVDREMGAKGTVARFVFTGKGWGHGVGLCQVGAYGMAQAGATYQEILGHYYTGITLDRAY